MGSLNFAKDPDETSLFTLICIWNRFIQVEVFLFEKEVSSVQQPKMPEKSDEHRHALKIACISAAAIIIAAAAKAQDVGCNTENAKGSFSNFVYQIKMTIREGIDDGNAGEAGPTFRVHDNGSQYHVSFDVNGY